MSVDPGAVDLGSLGALRAAFRAADEPELTDLEGVQADEADQIVVIVWGSPAAS